MSETTSHSATRSRRLFEGMLVALLVLSVAVWRFGPTIADPDLWGHLLTGLETLEAGSYLSVDSWSYLTEGQEWINHPWLGQAAMALTYHYLGSVGLVALKALLALGTVAILFWWSIRSGLPPVRAGVLTLLGVLALAPTLGTFRPQIFTVVGFVVVLLVMSGVENGTVRLLWILPPLFALWANLHGGYLAGLAFVGAWALIHLWEDRSRGRYWPLAAFLASVLAGLANPQGWRRLQFLLETASVPRPEIQDWQPIDLTSAVGIGYLALVAVVVSALLLDRRNVKWALALPLVGLAIAPVVAWRHLQLFAPAAIVLGAVHVNRAFGDSGSPGHDDRLDPAQNKTIALALATVVVATSAALGGLSPCIRVDADQFEFPQRVVSGWAAADARGNAVVPFNWGEYVRWHLGPEVLVSIDGRRETIYSTEVHELNLDFMAGRDNWEDLLDLAPADWILAPTGSPVVDRVTDTGDWHVAYRDREAILLSPGQIAIDGNDGLPIDGEGSCFPAGPTDRGGESFLAKT